MRKNHRTWKVILGLGGAGVLAMVAIPTLVACGKTTPPPPSNPNDAIANQIAGIVKTVHLSALQSFQVLTQQPASMATFGGVNPSGAQLRNRLVLTTGYARLVYTAIQASDALKASLGKYTLTDLQHDLAFNFNGASYDPGAEQMSVAVTWTPTTAGDGTPVNPGLSEGVVTISGFSSAFSPPASSVKS